MFCDESALFPDDALKLGNYLCPSIDIGPAVTAKVLTENGQVLHRSTYWSLTPEELLDNDRLVSLSDQQTIVQSRQVTCIATAGWQICCQWKDGSTSWKKLSELKESQPMQTAEFAFTQGIDHEPAFNLTKQETRYVKRSHKFGIELSKTVEEALTLDTMNCNTLLADAISKKWRMSKWHLKFYQIGSKYP